jgi:hypothetical protein
LQGRFKAILVDGDNHLPAVCRQAELNPVRDRMVPHRGDPVIGSAYRNPDLHTTDIAAAMGLPVWRISGLIAREERRAQVARDKT